MEEKVEFQKEEKHEKGVQERASNIDKSRVSQQLKNPFEVNDYGFK